MSSDRHCDPVPDPLYVNVLMYLKVTHPWWGVLQELSPVLENTGCVNSQSPLSPYLETITKAWIELFEVRSY